MSKFDSEDVKRAASGRWLDILVDVAGIPMELLDSSREHPCCKCGGATRFRLVDESAGAVFCNQCFSTKNGDGFAAIQWMNGVDFPTALELVANYLGIKPTGKRKGKSEKPPADPAKDLEFMTWSPILAALFCGVKKGVTEESLLAQGCRMAQYKKMTVIVWPVIGSNLDTDNPVGYVIMEHKCRPIPTYNFKGEPTGQVEKKVLSGSKPGFIGQRAIEAMKNAGQVELIWKCEGLTDQAAKWAAIPEHLRGSHVVISTANGSQENPKWQADILSNFNTLMAHDADEPGQAGAEKWALAIAGRVADGKFTKVVLPPYDIQPKKGKDFRDFYNEGNTYADALNLAEKAEPVIVARNDDGSVNEVEKKYPLHDLIMETLQLRIIEVEESGSVRVFSMLGRTPSTIRKVSQLRKDDIVEICGPPAMEMISEEPDPDDGTHNLKTVKEAISYYVWKHKCSMGNKELHGVGVWQGLDEYGNETETIVLVNNSEGARWNGDKLLKRVLEPTADGLSLNFGAGDADWFSFDLLEQNLKNAGDQAWRDSVIDNTYDLFAKWKWRNPEIDPTLMVGLVLATWIQTLWKWRPLVSVVGESNSGKSFLFEALGGNEHQMGLFGKLSFKQAKSTEAGIRQGVGRTGKVVICDEFEKSNERIRIMEMMRASTRGDTIARGTPGAQKGKRFSMRHICFTAAIEAGLQRQPDLNRFIQFQVRKPERGEHGKLKLPGGRELYELGQKLLAISVYFAIEAKKMAVTIKDTKADVDARTVESYAVPASILGLAMGHDEEKCRKLLKKLAEKSVDKDSQGDSDQEELLDAILSATINCGTQHGNLSVGQIIEATGMSRYIDNYGRLEAEGICITSKDELFINSRLVSRRLLRDTPWKDQRIDQILERLDGVRKIQHRLSGRVVRGIAVPHSHYITPPGDAAEATETESQGERRPPQQEFI